MQYKYLGKEQGRQQGDEKHEIDDRKNRYSGRDWNKDCCNYAHSRTQMSHLLQDAG